MPFEIICLKNKRFWSRVLTCVCGFAMVIIAVATVFPSSNSNTQEYASEQAQSQYTTTNVDE